MGDFVQQEKWSKYLT